MPCARALRALNDPPFLTPNRLLRRGLDPRTKLCSPIVCSPPTSSHPTSPQVRGDVSGAVSRLLCREQRGLEQRRAGIGGRNSRGCESGAFTTSWRACPPCHTSRSGFLALDRASSSCLHHYPPPHLTSAISDSVVIHSRDGSLTFIPPTSSTLSFYTPTEPSCQVDNLLDLHFSQCRTRNPAMATVGTTPSPAVR